MNKIISSLQQIQSDLQSEINSHQKTVEKNIELFKILASVKSDLEKTLKKPESLKETVYRCIDLLRENTPYYSASENRNKIDPPLTDSEKTL
jgi:hypothetical protein